MEPLRTLQPDRGIRIVTTVNATSAVVEDQKFVWCGDRICQERDGATNAINRELYAFGFQSGSDNRFYLQDHLGSVRGLVNDSGVVTSEYAYDPYGKMTRLSGSETPSYGYAQLWYHGQTGLDMAVYRAYDAKVGRWLSRDPIGVSGGINVYGYVGGDPVGWVDPSGYNWMYDRCEDDAHDEANECHKACWEDWVSGSQKTCRKGAISWTHCQQICKTELIKEVQWCADKWERNVGDEFVEVVREHPYFVVGGLIVVVGGVVIILGPGALVPVLAL